MDRSSVRKRASGRPPNVVVFICDRQHHASLIGRQRPDTPHLDRLAASGTTFIRAYCTAPLCTPARAFIYSGLYPHAHGMVANHQPRPGGDQMRFPPGMRTIGHRLSEIGYECAHSGKWHLGSGADRPGFHHVLFRGNAYDVDLPEQNDVFRLVRKVRVTIGGKYNGHEVQPEHFQADVNVGPTLLNLAEVPS